MSEKEAYEKSKILTKEDKIMIKQSRTGETWHGVPVYELSKVAESIPGGRYVEVRGDILYFYYSSKTLKIKKYADFEWNSYRKQMERVVYEEARIKRDLGDDFQEIVNEKFFPRDPDEEIGGVLGKILGFLACFFFPDNKRKR